MWRDAVLVAGKDLRVEVRSRVATNQVAPFAVSCWSCSPSRWTRAAASLARRRPGCSGWRCCSARCWPCSAASGSRRPTVPGTACGCPASTRRGSSSARRRPSPSSCSGSRCCSAPAWSCSTTHRSTASSWSSPLRVAATVGLAAAGTIYGGLAAGLKVRETLLPLLAAAGRWPRCSSAPPRPGRRRSAVSPGDGTELAAAPRRVRRHLRDGRSPRLRAIAGGGMTPVRDPITRLLGVAALVVTGAAIVHGLVIQGPDGRTGRAIRDSSSSTLPLATVTFVAFGITALASLLYLLPPHPQPGLGLTGRSVGGGRGRLLRPHPGHRLDLGPAGVGRVVDLGRPPHQRGAAARPVPRLPRAAAGPGRRDVRARRSRHRRRALRRGHPDRPLRHRRGGRPCTRAQLQACFRPTSSSTPPQLVGMLLGFVGDVADLCLAAHPSLPGRAARGTVGGGGIGACARRRRAEGRRAVAGRRRTRD